MPRRTVDQSLSAARGPCPVCGAKAWVDHLVTHTGRVMTSDQRVLTGQLWKVRCQGCGVVANGRPFRDEEVTQLYVQEYELNTSEQEEHLFYTPEGPVARSELFFRRIAPHLPDRCDSVLEIGCGAGNLLRRIADAMPRARVSGIDGSERAVALAQARGLNVQQGLVLEDVRPPKADVILLIGVLEHVEDVARFLGRVRGTLNPGGRIIFSLPVQDNFSYDLFFHEHVWHFDKNHAVQLLRSHGLRPVATDCDDPVNKLMGLYICEPDGDGKHAQAMEGLNGNSAPPAAIANRDAWLDVFDRIDCWLASRKPRRLAVFGGGEVLALLCAFTSLPDWSPIVCLDDDPNKIGSARQGIPVQPTRWLENHSVDAVLLATNPTYHDRVRARLMEFVDCDDVFAWDISKTAEAAGQA